MTSVLIAFWCGPRTRDRPSARRPRSSLGCDLTPPSTAFATIPTTQQLPCIRDYVELDQFLAGTLAIGFVFGAYMTETFRGAFMAIPEGQLDAGRATGFSRTQLFTRVMWPQMVRHALPGFSNNWLVLLKATALVSVIGLHDLVWNATTAGRSVREPFTFMFAVLLIYLLLTACSDVLLRWLGRRYALHGVGAQERGI